MDKPASDDLPSQTSAAVTEPEITFQGNAYDLMGLAVAGLSALTVFMCGTLMYGAYCLPLLLFIFGLVGLLNADKSANRERSRNYAWIGIGVGGLLSVVLLLMIVGFILLYVVLIAVALSAEGTGLQR